jgi:hypothetical protein
VSTARPAVSDSEHSFFPREHGATAMLLLPFLAGAILLRRVSWMEAIALAAIVLAFAVKDPLVVVARQRWVWNQPHPETRIARRWAALEILALAICGAALLYYGPRGAYILIGAGAAGFGALAIWVNVRNRQRAVWFQIASALALTSTSLLPGLSALGLIPRWAWTLWLLNALQSTAAIFVVHARLDARIAMRKSERGLSDNRRAAIVSIVVLVIAAGVFAVLQAPWVTAALILAVAGYAFELHRQQDARSLRSPLTHVGLQSLALAALYGTLIIAGLW